MLANLYIEEDIHTRERVTRTTTRFFERELENLRNQIIAYEGKISKFKAAHIGELPGSTNLNLQLISRLDQELDRINTKILTLREKKIYLDGQIVTVDPLKPVVTEDGKIIRNPKERLKYLHLKLLQHQHQIEHESPKNHFDLQEYYLTQDQDQHTLDHQ